MSGPGILIHVPTTGGRGQIRNNLTLPSSPFVASSLPSPGIRLPGPGLQQPPDGTGNHAQFSLVELGKRLLASARDGDAEEVRQLISKGAPFTTDWLGTSPLHLAAQFGHVETCKRLLSAGISKDARTKVDKTPLHIAAQEGHSEVMELLLRNGCEVDAVDMIHMTALHWAVERGNTTAIETLLRYGATVNVESKFSKSPLEIASDNGRPDIYEMLQHPESYRQINPYESDPITMAATNSISMSNEIDVEDIVGGETVQDDQVRIAKIEPADPDTQDVKNVQQFKAYELLKSHGISPLPEDNGANPLEKTLRISGGLALTEAGKQALTLSGGNIKTISGAPASKVTKTRIVALNSSCSSTLAAASTGGAIKLHSNSGDLSKVSKIIKLSPSDLAAIKSSTKVSNLPISIGVSGSTTRIITTQKPASSSNLKPVVPALGKNIKIIRVASTPPSSSSSVKPLSPLKTIATIPASSAALTATTVAALNASRNNDPQEMLQRQLEEAHKKLDNQSKFMLEAQKQLDRQKEEMEELRKTVQALKQQQQKPEENEKQTK